MNDDLQISDVKHCDTHYTTIYQLTERIHPTLAHHPEWIVHPTTIRYSAAGVFVAAHRRRPRLEYHGHQNHPLAFSCRQRSLLLLEK